MRELPSTAELSVPPLADGVEMGVGVERSSRSIWPSIYPAILELVRAAPLDDRLRQQPPPRRAARAAAQRARRRGARARAPRLARPRAAARGRGAAEGGRDPVPRRDVLARARHRHGRRRPRHPGREPEVGRARAAARRPRGPRAALGLEGPDLPEVPRRPARVGGRRARACARARSRRRGSRATRSTCSPSRSSRSAPTRRSRSTSSTSSSRRAYPFAELSRAQLENVLDMLAGRYPSDEFAELRPRIVWDRTAGTVRGRTGARRLAVTNAGTIPDRGLFGVFLVDGGGRVGELDEEMVYEAREGQTFLLGASTWRIEEITRDRVLVSPAPGVPGVAPFWKGEGVGRPAELGETIGRASRELVGARRRRCDRARRERVRARRARRPQPPHVPPRAGGGDRRRSRPTGPIVVERFRDEIGDWRVCILSPFGGRVHAPWAMALRARLRDSLGLDVQSLWSDDGIALHFPDADVPPPLADLLLEPDELEDLLARRARAVGAVRRALPRERRARAAHPAAPPGPAHAALAAAAEGAEPAPGRAPLSAVPDRARDVPRVPAGRLRPAGAARDPARDSDALARPSSRSRRRRRRRSPRRSSSTTSRRTCTRTTRRPRSGARRRCRSTATCCASSWASRSCASCSTSARSSRSSRRCDRRRATSTSSTTCCAARDRSSTASTTAGSPRRSCASGAPFACGSATGELLVAVEDAGLVRDAFGVVPPGGVPQVFLEPVEDALRAVLRRYAKTHGPFTTAEVAARFRLDVAAVDAELVALERDGRLVRGELRPGGTEREWCDPDVLRRIRRATLAVLRREVEPAEQAAFGRFLPALARDRPARRACARRSSRCRDRAAGDALGERRPAAPRCRLPARRISTCSARRARSSGSAPGSIASPSTSATTRALLGRRAPRRRPEGDGARRDSRRARSSARSSGPTSSTPPVSPREDVLPALWELVWAGEVTNDSWAPLRACAPLRAAATGSRGTALRAHATHDRVADAGPLVARVGALRRTTDRRALAELLLERQGIVTRDGVRGEGIRGGYGAVYARAQGARDARRLPARLLRRRARRRAVRACRARSSGCASCGRRARRRARGARARRGRSRRSRTARRCRGRSARALARRASPARGSSCSTARRRSSSSAAAARSCRSASPDRTGSGLRSRRSSRMCERAARSGSRSSASTARPSAETEVMQLLVEAGFLAGPRRAVLASVTAGEGVAGRVPGGVAVRAPSPLSAPPRIRPRLVRRARARARGGRRAAVRVRGARRAPRAVAVRAPPARARVHRGARADAARARGRAARGRGAPARAGGGDLRAGARGQARERGRGALPHRPPRSARSRPPRRAAASTGTTRRSRTRTPSSRRRSSASGAGTSPSRRSSGSRSRSRSSSRQASPCGRSWPASSRRTGPSRAVSFRATSDVSPIACVVVELRQRARRRRAAARRTPPRSPTPSARFG